MSNPVYFADVTLPFHVWVREGAGATGFSWVLRHASQLPNDEPSDGERCDNTAKGKGASGAPGGC